MASFEGVIRQALERQGGEDPAARERIYQSSRQALERMLAARPDQTEAMAARQRRDLEASIARIEADYGVAPPVAAPVNPPSPPASPPAGPAVTPPAAPPPTPRVSPPVSAPPVAPPIAPSVAPSIAPPVAPTVAPPAAPAPGGAPGRRDPELPPVGPARAEPAGDPARPVARQPRPAAAPVAPPVMSGEARDGDAPAIGGVGRDGYSAPPAVAPPAAAPPASRAARQDPVFEQTTPEEPGGHPRLDGPVRDGGPVARPRRGILRGLFGLLAVVAVLAVLAWLGLTIWRMVEPMLTPERPLASAPGAQTGGFTILSPTDTTALDLSGGRGRADLVTAANRPAIRIVSTRADDLGNPAEPITLAVPEGVLSELAGRRATVEIIAAAAEGTTASLAVECRFGSADCGRKRFSLGAQPEPVLFTVDLPADLSEGGSILLNTDMTPGAEQTGTGDAVDLFSARLLPAEE